jgi:Cysteine-rich CPCC
MKIGKPIIEDPTLWDGGVDYFVNAHGLAALDTSYHCPCCGYPTLASRGSFEVCAICYWEDDGQDSHDADRVRGGPNGSLSLTQAIRNFAVVGACEERMIDRVRQPTDQEKKFRRS